MPISEILVEELIVSLEQERRTLTDLIRMAAYRVESAMLRLIVALLKRNQDEGRAFLKALFQTPAELIPDENEQELLIRFHSIANPRFNNVLYNVCEALTGEGHHYRGAELRILYEGPRLASEHTYVRSSEIR